MCGIVGALSKDRIQGDPIENMLYLLHHRGPDDRGLYKSPHIHLGHTRLSILDLSLSGHQPMSYLNERFWISFNGEIYNYIELREQLVHLGYRFTSQTDTEVLVAAYAEWGKACLPKLRGMFAFAIWDTYRHTLFLARDRVGEKPLYYWHDQERFYFASEMKALLALLPHTPDLAPQAIDWFFHYQYVPEPYTPLQGVYKLPASHYVLIDVETWRIHPERYWNLQHLPPIEGEPAPLIQEALEQTIELTLRSDVPVGVALSGGLDSGAIAALAAPRYKETLQAFSVGYPGRPIHDERHQAEMLAKGLGLPFYDVELRTDDFVHIFPQLVAALDEPVADIAAYGFYAVMKLAAEQGVKVVLTGIGGDELFWGYAWVLEAVRLTGAKRKVLQKPMIPAWLWPGIGQLVEHPLYKKILHAHGLPGSLHSLMSRGSGLRQLRLRSPRQAVFYELTPDFCSALHWGPKLYSKKFLRQLPPQNPYMPCCFEPYEDVDTEIQICQLLFDTWLISNCLTLGDRVSMASSVETRLPLLDFHLIELIIGLRKARPGVEMGHKFWLKAALKGILPDSFLNAPKQGFQPPVQEWYSAILGKYLDEVVHNGYLVQLNILDATALRRFSEQAAQTPEHRILLYKVVLLEIWYRTVVLQSF